MRMDDNTDAKRILLASPPADWRRQPGRPCITWLSTVQQDLKQHHLMLPKAADLAQNRPLWWMMSTYGATQSWVACQKRRRRRNRLTYLLHAKSSGELISFGLIDRSVRSLNLSDLAQNRPLWGTMSRCGAMQSYSCMPETTTTQPNTKHYAWIYMKFLAKVRLGPISRWSGVTFTVTYRSQSPSKVIST